MVNGSIAPCTVGLNPMERYILYWRMGESHSQPESGGEKKSRASGGKKHQVV